MEALAGGLAGGASALAGLGKDYLALHGGTLTIAESLLVKARAPAGCGESGQPRRVREGREGKRMRFPSGWPCCLSER